jgi:hypothetical protein
MIGKKLNQNNVAHCTDRIQRMRLTPRRLCHVKITSSARRRILCIMVSIASVVIPMAIMVACLEFGLRCHIAAGKIAVCRSRERIIIRTLVVTLRAGLMTRRCVARASSRITVRIISVFTSWRAFWEMILGLQIALRLWQLA